jgi:hypothetical protein
MNSSLSLQTLTRVDTGSDSMMNSRPVVDPPFGLDVDIKIPYTNQQTFKEVKIEEAKVMRNLIPPRLPLESNMNIRYRSTIKADYVRKPFEVKRTEFQMLQTQKEQISRLSKMPTIDRTQADGKKSKEPKFELYSASDAKRDAEYREQQLKRYEEFVKSKTKNMTKSNKDLSWY